MKRYCKIVDGKTIIKDADEIVIRKNGKQTFNPSEQMIFADGWIEYVAPTNQPIEVDEPDNNIEIENLKQELADSDYKVIKCMEASLCGDMLPYDIYALHEERNELRRRINELEDEN